MPSLLLVADLPWVVDAVHAALDGAGHHLEVTADPEGAAESSLEQGVEVVLVDLQVGAMGGMAVVRALRAAAHAAGVTAPATVILLDRDADAFLAQRAGADAWIRKPFGAFALRGIVDRLTAAPTPAGPATP